MDNDGQWSSLYPFTIVISGVKRYFYVKDHLGNIRQTLDESKTVVAAQDYYPYGETLREYNNGQANEKYKFTEKERDVETGLDYFGARLYDSRLGIWYQVDPLWEKYHGWSPFNYTACNPLNIIDPKGDSIVVLSNPNSVNGAGHTGMLIGNEVTGWTYYSKNGAVSSSSPSGISDDITGKFSTIAEFAASDEGKNYEKGYLISTNAATDIKMKTTAKSEIESFYNVATDNCVDAVSRTLESGGLNGGNANWEANKAILFSSDNTNFLMNIINVTLDQAGPNKRYDRIQKNNVGEKIQFNSKK